MIPGYSIVCLKRRSVRLRPEADHGHAAAPSVICTQPMSLLLLASCRVSRAPLKLNKELCIDKELYQIQETPSIAQGAPPINLLSLFEYICRSTVIVSWFARKCHRSLGGYFLGTGNQD